MNKEEKKGTLNIIKNATNLNDILITDIKLLDIKEIPINEIIKS